MLLQSGLTCSLQKRIIPLFSFFPFFLLFFFFSCNQRKRKIKLLPFIGSFFWPCCLLHFPPFFFSLSFFHFWWIERVEGSLSIILCFLSLFLFIELYDLFLFIVHLEKLQEPRTHFPFKEKKNHFHLDPSTTHLSKRKKNNKNIILEIHNYQVLAKNYFK